MAVHRLFPPTTPPTPPPTTPVRRSPRLRSHCILATRKRASPEHQPKLLPLTPEPSPRCIRAQKRQKILDASSSPPKTRTRKRKALIPDDDQHRAVKKKRKENIVNDVLTATAATSSLKITLDLDTRQGAGSSRHRDEKNISQSQPRRYTRSSSSKQTALLALPHSKSTSNRSKPHSKCLQKHSPSRMMTRTMKKGLTCLDPDLTSSTQEVLAPGPLPTSPDTSQPIQSVLSDTTSSNPITNNLLSSHVIATPSNDLQSSTSTTPSSSSSAELTPSSDPLSSSSTSLSMSFMNVPLSNPIPLSMPLNLVFLNMPLSMSLSMLPPHTDISTTFAPSESELGFGFQPQEGFSSTEAHEGKRNAQETGGENIFMSAERPLPQQSTSSLLTPTNETASSSDASLPSHSQPLHYLPPPPQSCTPSLTTISTPTTIPSRLVISTNVSDQSQLISTSPTSQISPTSSSYVNPTSPPYPSPLKAVCFPPLPTSPPYPSSSASPEHQQFSPSVPHQLPTWSTLPSSDDRIKEWGQSLEQEMNIGLSIPVLSLGNLGSGQGDELHLAPPQGQQEQGDRSPLLEPAPQPPSPQLQISYPTLVPPSSLPSYPPSPPPCSSNSSLSSSRRYHRKIEYSSHQVPEWIPKLDKERSLWKVACKIRVWEITKRYAPDTIRAVVAQEAHDYYSLHKFPLGYGSVSVKSRKRKWRKIVEGANTSSLDPGLTMADSQSASGSSTMTMTPHLSPLSPTTKHRDDEFMSEETYSFELMDDDDDMDGLGSGARSMEDEWRGFDDNDDEFGFEDCDDDDDDDDDMYDEDDDDDEEVEEDQTKISGTRKGAVEDQDQDPDAEGEMEVDIEPFQDPSFNAELSSPTSPTSPTSSSKSKSRSKSDVSLGNESQSFVTSFYIPPVPPHMQMQMQMQQRQEEEQEAPPVLTPPLDSSTNPVSPSSSYSSSEGMPISATPDNSHAPPIQIHLPSAPHYQLSSNILPLPPPRLDSIRVFMLRQYEMGGLKTTGRGTPADRKRSAIWGWSGLGGGRMEHCGNGSKGELDDRTESESDDEGGKRDRPRLKLMLSDHDIVSERGEETKPALRLSLPGDTNDEDVRMPVVPAGFRCESDNDQDTTRTTHQPSSSSSPSPPSSSFVATDQTWDAFLASLDDKSQPQQQQQGEEGTFDSSVAASDSDPTTHGQLLLELDDHHLPSSHRHRRHLLGPPSPTLEGSNGMFIFDQGSDNSSSSSTWFGDDGMSESGSGSNGGSGGRSGVPGLVVVVGSSGTCPSDALALEGFNFTVGPDGSSTLSYALG